MYRGKGTKEVSGPSLIDSLNFATPLLEDSEINIVLKILKDNPFNFYSSLKRFKNYVSIDKIIEHMGYFLEHGVLKKEYQKEFEEWHKKKNSG